MLNISVMIIHFHQLQHVQLFKVANLSFQEAETGWHPTYRTNMPIRNPALTALNHHATSPINQA
jgi:hypothetical protein